MTDLSRTFFEGFVTRRHDGSDDDTEYIARDGAGVSACSGGGVADEEYERVQREMCVFLAGVGFAAEYPTPPEDGLPLGEEGGRDCRS